jgi:hypothetical protein
MRYIIIIAIISCTLKSYSNPSFKNNYKTVKLDTNNLGYKVLNKTNNISNILFKKSKKKSNVIYLTIGNKQTIVVNEHSTAYGLEGTSRSAELKKQIGPTIKGITVFKGKYGDMTAEKISDTETGYTFKEVQYPLNLTISFAGEKTSFEITEPGNWNVQINLKK